MSDYSQARHRDPPDPSDREETALYIGRVAGELRTLATAAGLPFLAYLLSMAEQDAQGTTPD